MTEQSPADRVNRASNDIFEATSFLSGTNAQFLEGLYAQYLANPASVDPEWQAYFASLGEQSLTPTQLGRGPAWQRDQKSSRPKDDLTSALAGEPPVKAAPAKGTSPTSAENARAVAQDSIRAVQMASAYRTIGHFEADLDPLKLPPRPPLPHLDPHSSDFHDAERDKPIFIDGVLGLGTASPRQI